MRNRSMSSTIELVTELGEKGWSTAEIAKESNLTISEVELILEVNSDRKINDSKEIEDRMKKIVFVDIPMKEIKVESDAQCYANTGNANCAYGGKVVFPINAVLAEKVKKDDNVKVVLLKTVTEKGNSGKNAGLFQQELDEINARIGAKITYETIDTDFVETKQNHEKRLRDMLSKIEQESEVYADITFGQKPLPMVLMCVLTFAEKFFDADVRKVVYGKVDFVKHDDGKSYPENPELYDVTSLYYLNNLMGAMEASSGKEALKALNAFFAL